MGSAVAWNDQSIALARLGRYEEVVESYDRALALDPEYVIAGSNRAKAIARLGRMDTS